MLTQKMKMKIKKQVPRWNSGRNLWTSWGWCSIMLPSKQNKKKRNIRNRWRLQEKRMKSRISKLPLVMLVNKMLINWRKITWNSITVSKEYWNSSKYIGIGIPRRWGLTHEKRNSGERLRMPLLQPSNLICRMVKSTTWKLFQLSLTNMRAPKDSSTW